MSDKMKRHEELRSSSATIFKRMLKHCAGKGMIFAVSMTKRLRKARESLLKGT